MDEPAILARSSSESVLSNSTIKLNVGGQIFMTTLTTLKRHGPNYFSSFMASKCNDVLFIDRDPEVFSHILNYLRGYSNVRDSLDVSVRQKFDDDVVFYQLKRVI